MRLIRSATFRLTALFLLLSAGLALCLAAVAWFGGGAVIRANLARDLGAEIARLDTMLARDGLDAVAGLVADGAETRGAALDTRRFLYRLEHPAGPPLGPDLRGAVAGAGRSGPHPRAERRTSRGLPGASRPATRASSSRSMPKRCTSFASFCARSSCWRSRFSFPSRCPAPI